MKPMWCSARRKRKKMTTQTTRLRTINLKCIQTKKTTLGSIWLAKRGSHQRIRFWHDPRSFLAQVTNGQTSVFKSFKSRWSAADLVSISQNLRKRKQRAIKISMKIWSITKLLRVLQEMRCPAAFLSLRPFLSKTKTKWPVQKKESKSGLIVWRERSGKSMKS